MFSLAFYAAIVYSELVGGGIMASFTLAFPMVLKNEGGFVDDPDDPGGATNRGICLRELRRIGDMVFDVDDDGDLDADDIRALTPEHTRLYYQRYFWKDYNYSRIKSQCVAGKVFDITVNCGPRRSHKILQTALNVLGSSLAEDGVIGPKTMAAINAADPCELLPEIRRRQARFYESLVQHKPVFAKYLNGWLKRAAA